MKPYEKQKIEDLAEELNLSTSRFIDSGLLVFFKELTKRIKRLEAEIKWKKDK